MVNTHEQDEVEKPFFSLSFEELDQILTQLFYIFTESFLILT